MHPAATALAATRLAFDAVEGLTRVVEGMHANIAAGAPPLGRGTDGRTRGVARLVYTSIHLVNAGARAALDRGLTRVPEAGRGPDARSAVRAALNGVVGDHLAATRNPLAIPMRLRSAGAPRPRLLLLVHGLCMNDRQWRWNGHDHGEALARELDLTPLYLHYNTGRHVSENGRELAALLEGVLAEWPVRDAELTILGHSMGGLVARSACHAAAALGHAWPARLRRLIFLGTPHHGTPLERGGNRLETLLGASPYLAPLARLGALRSAGITDLRYGNVREEDWWELDRFTRHRDRRTPTPLPHGVECHALAGTRDVLVPVRSALGIHRDPARTLAFPEAQRWVGEGLDHFALLDHPAVYARLVEIMAPDAPPRDRRTRAAS